MVILFGIEKIKNDCVLLGRPRLRLLTCFLLPETWCERIILKNFADGEFRTPPSSSANMFVDVVLLTFATQSHPPPYHKLFT